MNWKELKEKFDNLRRNTGLFHGLDLHAGDARLGRVASTVMYGERGTMAVISGYYSYKELSAYFDGYQAAMQSILTEKV